MKNAKEHAKLSVQIGNLAEAVRPADSDPYTQNLNLAVFHLRSAAKLVQEIAEHQASKEPPK